MTQRVRGWGRLSIMLETTVRRSPRACVFDSGFLRQYAGVAQVPAHAQNDDLLFEVSTLEQVALARVTTHGGQKAVILARLQLAPEPSPSTSDSMFVFNLVPTPEISPSSCTPNNAPEETLAFSNKSR